MNNPAASCEVSNTLLLKKYPKRFLSIHLKDIAYGASTGDQSGAAPGTASAVLGKGQVQWKDVLKAAVHAGVKQYFIEDEHPDALHQISESLKYLSQLR